MSASGQFLKHAPCLACASSDGLAIYADGSGWCFVCQTYIPSADDEKERPPQKMTKEFIPLKGDVAMLRSRGISEETCRQWCYELGEHHDKPCQIANYFNPSGRLVGQKLRYPDKTFSVRGEISSVLYGMHLWKDGGKKVVITEGELDALSVSQAQGGKWPVVSIPTGAQSAAKTLSQCIEWLDKFETIVLMFDMDEPGREAALNAATVLPVGKAYIASLPLKDANECLKAGKVQDIIQAIWNAKSFRPDGIVEVDDVLVELDKPVEYGLPWVFKTLTEATYGRRKGEIYGIGAGTGVGKTDFLTQQIAFDITTLGLKVGTVFLEQKPAETVKRVAGKVAQRRFHVPDAGWEPIELTRSVEKLRSRLVMYNSFGETAWTVVKSNIRYMVQASGVDVVYVDHLTAMADTADEKGSLEQIMKEMAGLANELNTIIVFVSHLTTPEGKPHEEGGRVTIRHFKGSRAIGFWSFFMFGLERDQQAEDEATRQTTTFRILKDRYTGQATGVTFALGYERVSGQLYEIEGAAPMFSDSEAIPPWSVDSTEF